MSDRGTNWSITINNPTPQDEEYIAIARQKGWKVEGQLEKGENGTPHYQLAVKTPQTRFSAMKKAFPRAHIELARNAPALLTYVNKEETRIGTLPTSSEMYPSLTKFWELLCDRIRPIEEYGCMQANPRRILDQFDDACKILITEGYHIESLAVNPSTRSMWNLYSLALQKRTETEKTDRQRQAELISQQATIPINADEKEVRSQEGTSQGPSSGSEDESDEEFSESEYSEA
jgi:hypothetical protein